MHFLPFGMGLGTALFGRGLGTTLFGRGLGTTIFGRGLGTTLFGRGLGSRRRVADRAGLHPSQANRAYSRLSVR